MDLQQVNPNNHVVFLLRDKNKDEVVLGAHSRTRKEKEKQVFTIAKLIRYPRYRPGKWDHDLMLVQVCTYLHVTQAICISYDAPVSSFL